MADSTIDVASIMNMVAALDPSAPKRDAKTAPAPMRTAATAPAPPARASAASAASSASAAAASPVDSAASAPVAQVAAKSAPHDVSAAEASAVVPAISDEEVRTRIVQMLSAELHVPLARVEAVVSLIDEGATIPFIARYRKEVTGGMDDVALRTLDERLSYLRNLEQRKLDVLTLIAAQGKLTPELRAEIEAATVLQRVEDLYKPYRKKRATRASKAREAGLEPLANIILMQPASSDDPLVVAAGYLNADAGVRHGPKRRSRVARDIVAELVAEDPENTADTASVHPAHGGDRLRGHRPGRKDPLRALLRVCRGRPLHPEPSRLGHQSRSARG